MISPILLLYVEFCFCSWADKVLREQGEQEGIGPERYYERQTESNRLQREGSAGRPETEKLNKESEREQRMSAGRKTLQRQKQRVQHLK